MKFYISYFYNIRFFPENLVPVSTAISDPQWFHDYKGMTYLFKDKRNVWNGVNCKGLSPYKVNNIDCKKNCELNPSTCAFIKGYSDYLHTLDFENIKKLLEVSCNKLQPNCDICLIVYEKPDNPCSERQSLINWFAENGVDLIEWNKSMA